MYKKIHFLTLFLLGTIALSAQTLTSGAYKVTLSNLSEEKSETVSWGEKIKISETTGNYRVEKNGQVLKSQKFYFLKNSQGEPMLNVSLTDQTGESMFYNKKDKTFALYDNEVKVLKFGSDKDLILSGILIVIMDWEKGY